MENKTLPRDVFLYLLQIITLAACAIAFGTLIFSYININWVDNVDYFCLSCDQSSIRYAMATLIIIFPVFVWVSRFLRIDTERHEEKRDLKIRRWLLYFTLFVAALIVIGDLVAILYNFLNGELTTRFVLKALTVLFIAGSIFIHYFSEIKDKKDQFKWIRIFDLVIVLIVGVSILGGFWIAGSPAQQRLVRLDDTRVQDLAFIQSEIVNYWQRKSELPANLDDLKNDISGFSAPVDPQSGERYEYRVINTNKFELCATFSTSNKEAIKRSEGSNSPRYFGLDQNSNWEHDIGRTCFEREIDPDLYPPFDNTAPPKLL